MKPWEKNRLLTYWLLLAVLTAAFGGKGVFTVVEMSRGLTEAFPADPPHRQDYWRWYRVARKSLAGDPLANPDSNIPGRPAAGAASWPSASMPAAPAVDEGLKFFKLPPAFAVLISPLGLLPYPLYVVVWYLSSVLAAAAAVMLAVQTVHGRWLPENPWAVALPALLACPFVWDDVTCGTCNLHILAFLMLGLYWAAKKRAFLGGLAIGLAISWKAYPAAILPVLFAGQRWGSLLANAAQGRGRAVLSCLADVRWRLLAAACAGVAIWTLAVPGAVRGFHRQWSETAAWYQRIIDPYLTDKPKKQWQQQGLRLKNQSLYALTHRLLRPIDARTDPSKGAPILVNVANVSSGTAGLAFVALVIAAAAAVALVCILRPLDAAPMPLAVEFAIGGCFILLASQIAWVYFYALLAPSLVVGAQCMFDSPCRRARRACAAAAVATLVLMALTPIPHVAACGPLAVLAAIWLAAMLVVRWERTT